MALAPLRGTRRGLREEDVVVRHGDDRDCQGVWTWRPLIRSSTSAGVVPDPSDAHVRRLDGPAICDRVREWDTDLDDVSPSSHDGVDDGGGGGEVGVASHDIGDEGSLCPAHPPAAAAAAAALSTLQPREPLEDGGDRAQSSMPCPLRDRVDILVAPARERDHYRLVLLHPSRQLHP